MIAALLTFVLVGLINAHAETCVPVMSADHVTTLKHNAFKVDRTWWMYKDVLNDFAYGPHFAPAVSALAADQHWIDVGGGIAVPMMQLTRAEFSADDRAVRFDPNHLARLPKLTVVVLSDDFREAILTSDEHRWLDRFRTFRRFVDPAHFRYFAGTPIEAYADPVQTFGAADVLTDVVGAAAYTDDLTKVLTQYLTELKIGGVGYVNGAFERTKIRDCRGRDVSPEAFLAMIRGAKVTPGDVRSVDNQPHPRGRLRTFRMVRTTERIFVPSLKMIEVRRGLPPHRTFAFAGCAP